MEIQNDAVGITHAGMKSDVVAEPPEGIDVNKLERRFVQTAIDEIKAELRNPNSELSCLIRQRAREAC